ncbi:MAG: 4Fe-4S binding protein [Bacillota bacterium]|nr:4Fe-4S binding protein [Bacillota bacterium]
MKNSKNKKYKKLKKTPYILFPISIIILLIMRTSLFFKLGINFEYIHNICSFAAIISILDNLNTSSQILISKTPLIVGLVTLLLTMIFGPIFCAYICPFGTFQKLIRKLGRKLKIKSRKVPEKLHKTLKLVKYIFLLFFILLIMFKSVDLYMKIDPYHTFIRIFYGGMTLSGSIYLLLVVIMSLSFDRPFCNYLCPYGAFFNLISIKRIFKVTRNKDECIDCKLCDKSCPVNITVSNIDTVNDINCIGCNSCIENCPKEEALKLKPNYKNAILAFILIILSSYFLIGVTKKNNVINANSSEVGIEEKIEKQEDIDKVVKESFGRHNGKGKHRTETNMEKNEILEDPKVSESTKVDENNEVNTETSTNSNNKACYIDGIYNSTVTGYRPKMTIQIEINNNTIKNIEILDNNETKSYLNFASPKIINEILSSNSTDVDAVSGATFTSQGIIDGVENCLIQAKK